MFKDIRLVIQLFKPASNLATIFDRHVEKIACTAEWASNILQTGQRYTGTE